MCRIISGRAVNLCSNFSYVCKMQHCAETHCYIVVRLRLFRRLYSYFVVLPLVELTRLISSIGSHSATHYSLSLIQRQQEPSRIASSFLFRIGFFDFNPISLRRVYRRRIIHRHNRRWRRTVGNDKRLVGRRIICFRFRTRWTRIRIKISRRTFRSTKIKMQSHTITKV